MRLFEPTRHRRGLPVVAIAAIVALLVPAPARAAPNELSNPAVSPGAGTTATVFSFSVDYTSNQASPPQSVAAVVAGLRIRLAPSGLPVAGTYSGQSRLPEGTWQVTFEADALVGNDPTLGGPTIVVADASPTAAPPQPTPPPATAVPTQAVTPDPTTSPSPRPTGSPLGTPGGALFTPSPTNEASETEPAKAQARRPPGIGFDSVAWVFLGGAMAGSGAAYLGVLVVARRSRARRTPNG